MVARCPACGCEAMAKGYIERNGENVVELWCLNPRCANFRRVVKEIGPKVKKEGD